MVPLFKITAIALLCCINYAASVELDCRTITEPKLFFCHRQRNKDRCRNKTIVDVIFERNATAALEEDYDMPRFCHPVLSNNVQFCWHDSYLRHMNLTSKKNRSYYYSQTVTRKYFKNIFSKIIEIAENIYLAPQLIFTPQETSKDISVVHYPVPGAEARLSVSTLIINGQMCNFGGQDNARSTKCFDNTTWKWMVNSQLPYIDRYSHDSIEHNGKRYHCGGIIPHYIEICTCNVYNLGRKRLADKRFIFGTNFKLFSRHNRVFAAGIVDNFCMPPKTSGHSIALYDVDNEVIVSLIYGNYKIRSIYYPCGSSSQVSASGTITAHQTTKEQTSVNSWVNVSMGSTDYNATISERQSTITSTYKSLTINPASPMATYSSLINGSLNSTYSENVTSRFSCMPSVQVTTVRNLLRLYVSEAAVGSDDITTKSKNDLMKRCVQVALLIRCSRCRFEVLTLKKTYIPIAVMGVSQKRIKRRSADDIDNALLNNLVENPLSVKLNHGGSRKVIGEKEAVCGGSESTLIIIVSVICGTILIVATMATAYLIWRDRFVTETEHRTADATNIQLQPVISDKIKMKSETMKDITPKQTSQSQIAFTKYVSKVKISDNLKAEPLQITYINTEIIKTKDSDTSHTISGIEIQSQTEKININSPKANETITTSQSVKEYTTTSKEPERYQNDVDIDFENDVNLAS